MRASQYCQSNEMIQKQRYQQTMCVEGILLGAHISRPPSVRGREIQTRTKATRVRTIVMQSAYYINVLLYQIY